MRIRKTILQRKDNIREDDHEVDELRVSQHSTNRAARNSAKTVRNKHSFR